MNKLTDLRGKERPEQWVKASSAQVCDAEVDESQCFSAAHCAESGATAIGCFQFTDIGRCDVVRDGEPRAGQTYPLRQRVIRQWRWPSQIY